MSKPFNASNVIETLFGANNLKVTFVDNHHAIQVVNLSAQARHNLMLGLLGRTPFDQLQKLRKEGEPLFEPENILNIVGVTSLVLDKDRPLLELHIAQGMSVYLSFPISGIEKFQIALSELENSLVNPTTH